MRYKKHSVEWYAERAAQAIYDLRDAIPAEDRARWVRLDKQAAQLSDYGARMAKLRIKK